MTIPYEECSADEISLVNLSGKKKIETSSITNSSNSGSIDTITSSTSANINLKDVQREKERENLRGYILSPSLLYLWNFPLSIEYANDEVRKLMQETLTLEDPSFSAENPPLKKIKIDEKQDENNLVMEDCSSTTVLCDEYEKKTSGVLHGKILTLNAIENLEKKNQKLYEKVKIFYNTDFPRTLQYVFKDFDQSFSETSKEFSDLWLSDKDIQGNFNIIFIIYLFYSKNLYIFFKIHFLSLQLIAKWS